MLQHIPSHDHHYPEGRILPNCDKRIANLHNMGDPLSISASIVAILQLAGTVVQYLNDVRGAPDDRRRLLGEISSTIGVLYTLKDQAERTQWGNPWSNTMRSLNQPTGPLEQFKTALEQLVCKLLPVKGLKKVETAFSWPFQKGEIKTILNSIERQKTLFILALQNDSM
jgi:hypothetical protein